MNVKPIEPRSGFSTARGNRAILYLEGRPVGDVAVKGWDGSWGYGDFRPAEQFAQYAPLYGIWSLLLHADGSDQRLSPEASLELSQAEARLDAIKAQLLFLKNEQWIKVAQLNIDGELLEWKEY